MKKTKKCEFKGGVINGAVSDVAAVTTLADLPSKEQLIARLLGSMMSPISGLAIVLDQIAKKKGEDAKVAVRNIRRDAMDALKKDLKAAEISEDEEKDLEAEVQTITDSFVKKIDLAIEEKTKELMTV